MHQRRYAFYLHNFSKRPDQPHNAKNLAPTKTSVQDLSLGIPWSYLHDSVSISNTCTIDTALMKLFFICKFALITMSSFESDPGLVWVLNLISDCIYTKVHHDWIAPSKKKWHDIINCNENDWNCWCGVLTVNIHFFTGDKRSSNGSDCIHNKFLILIFHLPTNHNCYKWLLLLAINQMWKKSTKH